MLFDRQQIMMPEVSEVMSFGLDPNNQLAIWVVVDTNTAITGKSFALFGTGHYIPGDVWDSYKFVGTCVQMQFVWHLFVWDWEKAKAAGVIP